MRRNIFTYPIIVLVLLLCGFVSCSTPDGIALDIEKRLHEQQLKANQLTEQLCQIIEDKKYDSLSNFVSVAEDIHF